MSDRTAELTRALAELGFETPVKITGEQGDRVLYESVSGQPMMDAPAAYLRGGSIVLEEPSGPPL